MNLDRSKGVWQKVAPVFICLLVVVVSSCANLHKDSSNRTGSLDVGAYDLVIDGMPRDVSEIEVGSFSNAVENVADYGALTAIVAFRVVDIVKNDQPLKKYLPRLNLKAIISAATPSQFKKLFKRDLLKVGDDIEKRWFRVAVVDPSETFGISSWDQPEPLTHRLYLNRHQNMNDTFVMMKAERLS